MLLFLLALLYRPALRRCRATAVCAKHLAMLAREFVAVPPRTPPNTRSHEKILGYSEHGAE